MPNWRLRFTRFAGASEDTAATPSRTWPTVHRELKRKHVTLLIVGVEDIAATLAATAILGSANSIAALNRSCRRRRGRRISRASGCSSITRATGLRSSLTGSPGKSAWRRSSSPCSAPPAASSRTRAGGRRSRIDPRPRARARGDRRRPAIACAGQATPPSSGRRSTRRSIGHSVEMAAHYGAAICGRGPAAPGQSQS